MAKFTYNDIVRVRLGSMATPRRDRAWVVGIFEKHLYVDKFPEGFFYTVEFEDGTSIEVHEDDLEPAPLD